MLNIITDKNLFQFVDISPYISTQNCNNSNYYGFMSHEFVVDLLIQ